MICDHPQLHEFFITFNMILCTILSVTSVHPRVQENLPSSGLLQSSFVSLYMMYLTWSAMSNQVKDIITRTPTRIGLLLVLFLLYFLSVSLIRTASWTWPPECSVTPVPGRWPQGRTPACPAWTPPASLAWSSGSAASSTHPSAPAQLARQAIPAL